MTRLLLIFLAAAVAGCLGPPPRPTGIEPDISAELESVSRRKQPAQPPSVEAALLPPLRMDMPVAAGKPIEPRFDLSVNNAPATQVFMSIVSGTRYSMLVHPDVAGTISVNLKDVTILEALESLRELYGYEYRIDGARVSVQSAGLQTRVYRVNYLAGRRQGMSELRVQSGSVTDAASASTAPQPATATLPIPGAAPGTGTTRALDSSRVVTQQSSDFWADLRTALTAITGAGQGRTVVVSGQSGVVVVRALPSELRAVENYLRESRLATERQVMLEAKIIEVTLADAYQAGINWAVFRNSGPNAVMGQLTNAVGTTTLATRNSVNPLSAGAMSVDTAERLAIAAGTALAATNPASAVFGIALQTSNFAALLQFLESQGSVQVLSSPRVATINNQKAILKVGTDQFFVTNVSTVTTTTAVGTQQTPTVTVAPFFSGIVLDVTPQIDDSGNIMLHVHPSVSEVTEDQRVVNLGGSVPSITLPLAKSTVSETDTIVRVGDGNIVAIGGLMSVDVRDARGGLPGVSESFSFLRNTNRQARKKELVILLKPTIIQSDREWEQDVRQAQDRLRNMYPPQQPAPPEQVNYLRHFGLREPPFGITPDTSFFYPCRSTQEALNTLLIAVSNGEGFIKITGEVGTGKTLLCRKFLATLDAGWVTGYIPNPSLEPRTLLLALAEELEAPVDAGVDQHHLLKAIARTLLDLARNHKRVVLCMDESQAMPLDTLEALRLLTNLETEKRKLLQVVLFGQPELDRKLSSESIRQLRQRIIFQYDLKALQEDEVGAYFDHRLGVAGYSGGPMLDRGTRKALYRASRGVPRLVNILAHKALLLAYGAGELRLARGHVVAAAKDTPAAVSPQPWWWPRLKLSRSAE